LPKKDKEQTLVHFHQLIYKYACCDYGYGCRYRKCQLPDKRIAVVKKVADETRYVGDNL